MTSIERIRRNVLNMTQAEMAKAIGVTQPTISRWEKGALAPSLDELKKIREIAISAGSDWSDSAFFEAA